MEDIENGCFAKVPFLLRQPYMPLESVVFGLGGMILVIAALFIASGGYGDLPYYANGFYGILLVLVSLQMVAWGKFPLGSFRTSKSLLGSGVVVAASGVGACCIPSFQEVPRLLCMLYFGGGGGIMLIRMMIKKDKLEQCLEWGGLARYQRVCHGGTYMMLVMVAAAIGWEAIIPSIFLSGIMLLAALFLFWQAAILCTSYYKYPEMGGIVHGQIKLSANQVLLILLGVFLILLGILLFPVVLGWLSFSPGAQIGLLMIFFALQMLVAGETPIGPFPRNWLVIGCGGLFALTGIVSCLMPSLLLQPLTIWVGGVNIANGLMNLCCCWRLAAQRNRSVSPELAALGRDLFVLQMMIGVLAIIFGGSMLLPGIIPGLVIGGVLITDGIALLGLVYVLIQLERIG